MPELLIEKRTHTKRPTAAAERFEVFDGLRGLALLAILLINTLYFLGHYSRAVEIPRDLASVVVVWVLNVAVEQKGLGLFALLFGAGMALQLRKVQDGSGSSVILLRRYVLLLCFGVAHIVLLWDGDILRYLAVAGALLLVLGRLSDAFIRSSVVICLIAPVLVCAVIAGANMVPVSELAPSDSAIVEKADEEEETAAAASEIRKTGTYFELVAHRSGHILPPVGRVVGPGGLFYVLGMAMLGLFAVRRDWHTAVADSPWRWRGWLLAIGLGGSFLYAWTRQGDDVWQFTALMVGAYVGGAALTSFYAAWWVRSWYRPGGPGWMHLLAPAGRMALTHYLLQSVVMTTLMYGYGGGLLGRITPLQGLLIALTLYGLQVATSIWWLRHFRFGPAEWLWRSLTYLKLQPMRA